MIASTPEFLARFLREHKGFKNILEVGALDVTGNLTSLIPPDAEYVTTDMRGGSNVGLVINAHDLLEHFGPDRFDLILCFDTLEHDDMFWLSWKNMKAVLKPGGWILLGMPGRYCPLHEHPRDYYRFMPQSFEDYFFKGMGEVNIEVLRQEVKIEGEAKVFECEIYGWGKKI